MKNLKITSLLLSTVFLFGGFNSAYANANANANQSRRRLWSDADVKEEAPKQPNPVWKEFYVAVNGSDDGDGSVNNPFLTLEHAKDAAAAISDDMQGDIIINIAPGEYRLTEVWSHNKEDSGKNGYKIVYRGDEKNKPLISGGDHITGFQLHDAEKNIWAAKADNLDCLRELYVNGERRYVAQTNREVGAVELPEELKEKYKTIKEAPQNGLSYYDPNTPYKYDGFFMSKTDLPLCENAEDMEFYAITEYMNVQMCIDKILQDPYREDCVLVIPKQNQYEYEFQKNSLVVDMTATLPYGKSFIKNAYELLDEPGEFYFNRKTKMLYYIPFDKEDMTSADVIAPVMDRMVNIRGNGQKEEDTTKDIAFENLEFAYTTNSAISLYDQTFVLGQGSRLRGNGGGLMLTEAINIQMAEHISFTGCVFHSMGTSCIDMDIGIAHDIDIVGNAFYDIAGTAIQGGDPDQFYHFIDIQKERYPGKAPNGELLNLLTIGDCDIETSYADVEYLSGDYRRTSKLRTVFGSCWWNGGWWKTYMEPDDWEKAIFTWRSDPLGEEKNERAWVVYDVRDEYTMEDITLYWKDAHGVTPAEKSNFEVLLSNDKTFKEGSYYTVATQKTPADSLQTYKVNSDEKYRYLMIRKLDNSRLALTAASMTTAERPTYDMLGRIDGVNISNNYLVRCAGDYVTGGAIFLGSVDNANIYHNSVIDTGYCGINLGFAWSIEPVSELKKNADGEWVMSNPDVSYATFGRNANIEGNLLYNADRMGVDGGPFYSIGTFGQNAKMHKNYIFNAGNSKQGLYLDGSTDHIDLFDNVGAHMINFDTADYCNYKAYIPFWNNYNSSSKTMATDWDWREPLIVYPVGIYSGDAYDVVANAGVEKEYKHLAELIPDGYLHYTDAEGAYVKGNRFNMYRDAFEAAAESAQYAADLGRGGNGLGVYPYEVYYSIKDELKGIADIGDSETMADAQHIRDFLIKVENSVRRYSVEETLALCEKLADTVKTYPADGTNRKGWITEEELLSFKEEIAKAKSMIDEGKKDYQALSILENAYNEVNSSMEGIRINYAYIPEMKYVSIDDENRTATVYLENTLDAEKCTLEVAVPDGIKVGDVFENVNLLHGVNVPLYDTETGEQEIWKVVCARADEKGETCDTISENSFVSVTDKEIPVALSGKYVTLMPDTNAVVSKYYNAVGERTEFDFRINSEYMKPKFSLFFGINPNEEFRRNRSTGNKPYFRVDFEGDFAKLYSVSNGKAKCLQTKRINIETVRDYKLSYQISTDGVVSEIKIALDGKEIFDSYDKMTVGGLAWGSQADETVVAIKKK